VASTGRTPGAATPGAVRDRGVPPCPPPSLRTPEGEEPVRAPHPPGRSARLRTR